MMDDILCVEEMVHPVDVMLVLEDPREFADDVLVPLLWRHVPFSVDVGLSTNIQPLG